MIEYAWNLRKKYTTRTNAECREKRRFLIDGTEREVQVRKTKQNKCTSDRDNVKREGRRGSRRVFTRESKSPITYTPSPLVPHDRATARSRIQIIILCVRSEPSIARGRSRRTPAFRELERRPETPRLLQVLRKHLISSNIPIRH